MLTRFVFSIAFLISLDAISATAAPENWPAWRGPRGDGTVEGSPELPVKFDIEKDVVWKTRIPGIGHASPVIWKDRIFLVTADEETSTRSLLAIDRTSGKQFWSKVVLEAPFEEIHRLNSRASSTPATDGKSVFVSFLMGDSMFVAAYDFEGNEIWKTVPGVFSSKHGYCSCPVLWNGKVIINGDHDGEAYLVALDKNTGEEIWKTDRPNKTRSYCTPIIRKIGERNQMILSGSKSVASYDPDTGKQHWIIDGPTEQFVASLVYNEDLNLLFLTCGFPQKHMMAIRPDGSGNVTDTHIVWRETVGASYVPSPIAIGEYFLVVADSGVASCFVAKTGERLWRERLPGKHSASIVAANGLAYFTSDSGIVSAVKPGPDFEVVAESEVGEEVYASPAVFENQFYIRGEQHLFCIGSEDSPEPGIDSATRERSLGILRAGMKSDDFWPSIHAAEGLTLAGHGSEVIEYLTPKLPTETDQQHLCGVSRELIRAGEKQHVEVMADILRGHDSYAHTHAAESLYKVHQVGDLEAMKKAFGKEGELVLRLMAAAALIRHGETPEAIEFVRKALATDDPDQNGLRIGSWILGRVGDSSDIPRIKSRIGATSDPLIKAYMQHALAALNDPTGLEALKQNLKSEDKDLRTYAATFAGDVGDPALIPNLIPLLDDPHPDASYRAAQSILQLASM